jgi:hypothetical protein
MTTSYFGQIYAPNGKSLLTAVNGGGLGGAAPGIARIGSKGTALNSETLGLLMQLSLEITTARHSVFRRQITKSLVYGMNFGWG